ncbi:MAG: DUF1800 domain-containing protein [Saprospiraceae bacterium]|nr:DUF1800 domain-containing protein [Saprospiraceae bacterium]
MDRRATLATLLGKSKNKSVQEDSFMPPASGLDPYTGPWGPEQAAHLLRRATFGPTIEHIRQATQDGLDGTVANLLADIPMPAPPLNYYYEDDPYCAVGESWVDKGYVQGDSNLGNIRTMRFRSMRAWTLDQMLKEGIHLREKMTLFWHNHFVTADEGEPMYTWNYINTLRENALGNVKELVKLVTVDAGMLRYLNGNQNRKNSPNENYARELFELFTIGKGPQVRFGDYTNYTEADIQSAAKVLTGFIVRFSNMYNEYYHDISEYIQSYHDTSTKTFSHRFNYATIDNADGEEYKLLVDMIFKKRECARFLCRKLYRYFVYYKITPDVEANVIEPMSQVLHGSGYNIKPALEALFKSQHFHDMLNVGPMIKNPFDFIFGPMRACYYADTIPSDLYDRYLQLRQAYDYQWKFNLMQMEYFRHPSVAGWKAYYQEPGFYRIWINSATLPPRRDIRKYFLYASSRGVPLTNVRLDVLKLVERMDNPFEPNQLIDDLVRLFMPQPISQSQKDYLKELLIPGLPDYEWTLEYNMYVSDPDDEDMKNAIDSKLRALLNGILEMPESFLS